MTSRLVANCSTTFPLPLAKSRSKVDLCKRSSAEFVASSNVDSAVEAHRVLVGLPIHLVEIVEAAVGGFVGCAVWVLGKEKKN